MAGSAARATNPTLNPELVAEARALNVNVSRAAESGIVAAIRKERDRKWQKENAEAIRSSNEWVEKHGLPPEKHRPF